MYVVKQVTILCLQIVRTLFLISFLPNQDAFFNILKLLRRIFLCVLLEQVEFRLAWFSIRIDWSCVKIAQFQSKRWVSSSSFPWSISKTKEVGCSFQAYFPVRASREFIVFHVPSPYWGVFLFLTNSSFIWLLFLFANVSSTCGTTILLVHAEFLRKIPPPQGNSQSFSI